MCSKVTLYNNRVSKTQEKFFTKKKKMILINGKIRLRANCAQSTNIERLNEMLLNVELTRNLSKKIER